MAHQWMRANLSSAVYPFATPLFGRTIIVPQFDQNFDRTLASTADPDKDKGIPQAYYMHNCVPTGQGYQSIGYETKIVGDPTVDDFDEIFPLQNEDLNRFLFSPAQGKNYIFDRMNGGWKSVSPILFGISANTLVTVAFLKGQSYIYYGNLGAYVYNDATKTLDNVVLSGLVPGDVKGLCGANGYLIAWDDFTIAWSSLVTPTDFVPSLITGAGGGNINDALGKILCCLPVSGGFIVYCEKNMVAAKFTGNVRFPFTFLQIPGSSGIKGPEQVTWQSNLAAHFAWTTAGLQEISKLDAKDVYPEATDWLASLMFEDFDENTLVVSQTYLTNPLNIKMNIIADRYMIISYGITAPEYTHALVMDLALKRWGKFKITHRDVFDWNSPNPYGVLTYGDLFGTTYGDLSETTYGDLLTRVRAIDVPKKTIAFLQGDGTVKTVNFNLAQTDASGVLILGKFEFQRNRRIVHQQSDVETVLVGNNFQFYLYTTEDGKDLLPAVAPFLFLNGALMKRYKKSLDGQNISALFVGAFNLNSYLMDFTVGGES